MKFMLYSWFKAFVWAFRATAVGLVILLAACGGGPKEEETKDATAPVIKLIGEAEIEVNYGITYEDLFATATDDVDGVISVKASGIEDIDVSIHSIGKTFEVVYTATDRAGNTATAARRVTVRDFTPPHINLDEGIDVQVGYAEDFPTLTVSATDEVDGRVDYVSSGLLEVDTSIANIGKTYSVYYSAKDSSGNESQVTQTITIIDNKPPILVLEGPEYQDFAEGSGSYVDPGFFADDEVDGVLDVKVTGDKVQTRRVGEYRIVYTATDFSGNETRLTRVVNVHPPKPFITTWQTFNSGASDPLTINITVPSRDYAFYYDVDWGDGQTSTGLTDSHSHTYEEEGIYEVSISGVFPSISFQQEGADPEKLIAINQWGDQIWESLTASFKGATNLEILATDAPLLAYVSDLDETFSGAHSITSGLEDWDVSNIKSMRETFKDARNFNGEIDGWDVSNVRNMSGMFYQAQSFNRYLGNWNVALVTDMSSMFYSAVQFNQPLSNWNIANVRYFDHMFYQAYNFDQPLNSWGEKLSSAYSMDGMFQDASSFNQNLNQWDVGYVVSMNNMFKSAVGFNGDISTWNVANVQSMSNMFEGAILFNQDLSGWNFSKVSSLSEAFTISGFDSENYGKLLTSLAASESLRSHVELGLGHIQYTEDMQRARDYLESTYNWVILDGGPLVLEPELF